MAGDTTRPQEIVDKLKAIQRECNNKLATQNGPESDELAALRTGLQQGLSRIETSQGAIGNIDDTPVWPTPEFERSVIMRPRAFEDPRVDLHMRLRDLQQIKEDFIARKKLAETKSGELDCSFLKLMQLMEATQRKIGEGAARDAGPDLQDADFAQSTTEDDGE